jgi:outer membrane protein TolC
MSKTNVFKIAVFLFCLPFAAPAQVGNYDDLVPPPDVRPRNFEDYLVQLAWENNPQRKVAGQEVAVAKSQVKAAKKSWMEPIGANLGFNSVRDTVTFSGSRYLAPGYNYGISLSLGSMFTNKGKVNLANEKVNV